MSERDRLAEHLHRNACPLGTFRADDDWRLCAHSDHGMDADRLIALGWTRSGDDALLHEMRTYARHAPLCEYSPTYPDAPIATCDCGFDALLARYELWPRGPLPGAATLDEERLARALERHMADFEAAPESFESIRLVAANVAKAYREDTDANK